jgi:hypothetical protein
LVNISFLEAKGEYAYLIHMALETFSGVMISQAMLASKMVGTVEEMILVGLVAREGHLATDLGRTSRRRRHETVPRWRRHIDHEFNRGTVEDLEGRKDIIQIMIE